MLKYIVLSSCLALLTGCQTVQVPQNTYSSTADSRIRLYGENQKPTIMKYRDNAGHTQKINVGGDLGEAIFSLVNTVENRSIGIAETVTSKNLGTKNGLLADAFYKEFVIPSGTKVNLRNEFGGVPTIAQSVSQVIPRYEGHCTSPSLSFVPQVGKDYEVIPVSKTSSCGLILLEVDQLGNTAQIDLVY